MLSAATRQRKSGSSSAKQSSDFVGEEDVQSLYENRSPGGMNPWIRPSGKHVPQPIGSLAGNLLAEIGGCVLLGLVVGLVRWAANSDNFLINAAFVALAYAGTYYIVTRCFSFNHVYRRHLNPAISAGYFALNEIGLVGLILYLLAQLVGLVLGGVALQIILSGGPHPGALISGVPVSLTVPYPRLNAMTAPVTTLPSNLILIIMAELVFCAIVYSVLFITEFVNTPPVLVTLANPSSGRSSYRKATKYTSIILFLVVLCMFPFQVYTFSPVVYGSGLVSGLLRNPIVSADDNLNDTRSSANMWNLDSNLYPNSVFGVDGKAAWHYLLTPFAGLIIAIGVTIITLYIHGTSDKASGVRPGFLNNKAVPIVVEERAPSSDYVDAASRQTQVQGQLRHPLLKRGD